MKQTYNQYFSTPPYLYMNAFSIDISDQFIKYGKLIATTSGLNLTNFGKEQIPLGTIVNGAIVNENILMNILKNLKKKKGIKYVRVSIPNEQMYFFTLSLPKINKDNLRDIILSQIEKYIPRKAVDVTFQYDIIATSSKEITLEVLAIPTRVMDEYLSVFKKAGLSVLSLESEAQAISRVAVPYNAKPVLIVNVDGSRACIFIAQNERVFLATTLSIHDDSFLVILKNIQFLKEKFDKSNLYLENNEPCSVEHIVLCGDTVLGLSDKLENVLRIKVDYANVWINISDINTFIPSVSFEDSLGYSTVLGLALNNFSSSSEPLMNILPLKEKKIIKNEYKKRYIVVFIMFLIAIFTVFILLLIPSYLSSNLQEKRAENNLEEFNSNNKYLTDKNINTIISNINQKLDSLTSNTSNYSVYENILGTILSTKSEGITFSQILFNQDNGLNVELHGMAKDTRSLNNFELGINSNPSILTSNLTILDSTKKNNIDFNVSINLK